jgi:outer membrane protein TolC
MRSVPLLTAAFLSMTPAAVRAQSDPDAVGLSWSAADRQLTSSAAEVSAADHEAKAADLTAQSLRTLHLPTVNLSAQLVTYQKTLSVDLSGLKSRTTQDFEAYLGALPGQFPADLQGIVAAVTQRIDQALPGLLQPIPDSLSYQSRDTLFRPTVSAFLPLYTGGAIESLQKGAGAAARAARARADAGRNLARVNLARAYFGLILADGLVGTASETLAAFDRHLANTQAFYRNGVLPRAKVLEVQVARDAAARTLDRATIDRQRAAEALSRLLEVRGPVAPITPMFVHRQPLPAAIGPADGDAPLNPRVKEAEAATGVADAGVGLARSKFLPQAYAFGEYSFDRKSTAPTEPDWIAGVGVRWTLISPVDRGKALAAAKEHALAAADAVTAARKAAETEIADARALAEAARRSFLSLDSSITSARENQRVAEIAYREGEGTAAAVIDARAALSAAETQRLSAAYEYDVALAALLAASGRMDDYEAAIATADVKVMP